MCQFRMIQRHMYKIVPSSKIKTQKPPHYPLGFVIVSKNEPTHPLSLRFGCSKLFFPQKTTKFSRNNNNITKTCLSQRGYKSAVAPAGGGGTPTIRRPTELNPHPFSLSLLCLSPFIILFPSPGSTTLPSPATLLLPLQPPQSFGATLHNLPFSVNTLCVCPSKFTCSLMQFLFLLYPILFPPGCIHPSIASVLPLFAHSQSQRPAGEFISPVLPLFLLLQFWR